MAGRESRGGNTLLTDFILFAQRLEGLGFTYHKGKVMIIEPNRQYNEKLLADGGPAEFKAIQTARYSVNLLYY